MWQKLHLTKHNSTKNMLRDHQTTGVTIHVEPL